jgi:hypothetical protein
LKHPVKFGDHDIHEICQTGGDMKTIHLL